jgi:hypothetical protein
VSDTLSVRLTRRYVGTYKHLDEWRDIGGYEVLETRTKHVDDADVTAPARTTIVVAIKCDDPDESDAIIRKALYDTFTHEGCHHEYDCCGCRSFSVTNIKRLHRKSRLFDQMWRVNVYSSRNF